MAEEQETGHAQNVIVKQPDIWILLLSCIRYSMGRRTYMSSLAGELVQRYHKVLTNHQLKQIADEVYSEMKVNDDFPGRLGHDCDVASWTQFHEWCLEELKRRGQ